MALYGRSNCSETTTLWCRSPAIALSRICVDIPSIWDIDLHKSPFISTIKPKGLRRRHPSSQLRYTSLILTSYRELAMEVTSISYQMRGAGLLHRRATNSISCCKHGTASTMFNVQQTYTEQTKWNAVVSLITRQGLQPRRKNRVSSDNLMSVCRF